MSYGDIFNCYSAGSVSGDYGFVGGLVGWDNSGDYTSCFCDITINPLLSGIGNTTDPNVTEESTANMQTAGTFTDAGWDFVGESTNGTENIWRLCVDETHYPKLAWQFQLADFLCPDGVETSDLALLCEQWLLEELAADVGPNGGGDGIVNFLDWAIFAGSWQITFDFDDLADFVDQWLKTGASYYIADIAPDRGDGVVNMLDFAAFAENWIGSVE